MNFEGLEQEFALFRAVVEIEQCLVDLEDLMPNTISEATRSISTGIDAVKKLADLAMKTQNIDLQEGILELREQLLFAKESLLNAREEISDLKEENRSLTKQLEKSKETAAIEMEVKRSLYYVKSSGDGPFCPRCFDVDKQQVRLSKMGPLFNCPQCKNQTMPR
jgi:chromosome segregation ATPase